MPMRSARMRPEFGSAKNSRHAGHADARITLQKLPRMSIDWKL
jgi:hypothetical protein